MGFLFLAGALATSAFGVEVGEGDRGEEATMATQDLGTAS